MPIHNFRRPRGRVVEISIASERLGANLLGDPAERVVAVYLPEAYDREPSRRFPLLVDLAAFTGSGLKRLAWTAFGESVPQRLDRLESEGRLGPVVVAFPDAFTSLGGNQYVDSAVLGHWETFIAHDLVDALEREFRLLGGPKHRAIYGKSSGGYGALRQGLFHADRWSALACHSGDMGFDIAYRRDFPATADALARYGGDIAAFLDGVRRAAKVSSGDLQAMMTIALAASYDPDPDAPAGAVLPFDLDTCTLDHERWERWLEHDPLRIIESERAQTNLRGVSLFFDCGRRDQYFLHYGNRAFSQRLHSLAIEHHYEEFDDNHSSIDYRLDQSLPRLYRLISPP